MNYLAYYVSDVPHPNGELPVEGVIQIVTRYGVRYLRVVDVPEDENDPLIWASNHTGAHETFLNIVEEESLK